jgi:hypothetical protein
MDKPGLTASLVVSAGRWGGLFGVIRGWHWGPWELLGVAVFFRFCALVSSRVTRSEDWERAQSEATCVLSRRLKEDDLTSSRLHARFLRAKTAFIMYITLNLGIK